MAPEKTGCRGGAKYTFCKICGTKLFHVPRSNPDGIDINVRCLKTKPNSISIVKFDGQNREKNTHTLEHESK